MLLDGEVLSVSTHSSGVSVPHEILVCLTSLRGDVGCPGVLLAEERVPRRPSVSVARGPGTITPSAAYAAEWATLRKCVPSAEGVLMTPPVQGSVLNAMQVECVGIVTHAIMVA